MKTELQERSCGTTMPWQWCNLRRNPFGELTRAERAQLAVVDIQGIVQQVSQDHTAVQFIGDCGRGKTTRMLALAHAMADASYVYLPEDGPCPSIAVGRPILIDEAQRLPRKVGKAVFASGLPLVLATHRDLSRSLRRFGYSVDTQSIGAANTPELICKLLNRRVEASRREPDVAVPRLSLHDATVLVRKFGSDVRSMESYLYDVVQSQSFVSLGLDHGQMRFVD
ncbi:hypothetical protein [Planctomycetes bacterium K23_9]|uniref:AAA+ ATPase domain-containing protein n=1 Tax=Stieleria marina TaxID=1930275 RepID=A0A517NNL5_9BACT|nr:hypothetical protein K239x_06570 [Planctomycetes bacterium K23_9]